MSQTGFLSVHVLKNKNTFGRFFGDLVISKKNLGESIGNLGGKATFRIF